MRKINNIKECKILLDSLKNKKNISNTIVNINKYMQAIENENLYYIENEDIIFLLNDKGEFYEVDFFYFDNDLDKNVLVADKPMIISIITRNNIDIDNQRAIIEKVGFTQYKKHIRMKVSYDDYQEGIPNEKVEIVKLNSIEDIKTILHDNFDLFTEDIPDDNNLKKYIENKSIIAMVDKNDIMGLIIYSISNGICEIKFCVVKSQYRGMKIGYSLLLALKNFLSKDVQTFFIWMRDDNERAKNLYRKVGFTEDNRISIEFIKR